MGLRLREGVDLTRIAGLSGKPIHELIDEAALARLAAQGLLRREHDRLRVTRGGMLLLDGILAELVRT